jgi:hypothetical protein
MDMMVFLLLAVVGGLLVGGVLLALKKRAASKPELAKSGNTNSQDDMEDMIGDHHSTHSKMANVMNMLGSDLAGAEEGSDAFKALQSEAAERRKRIERQILARGGETRRHMGGPLGGPMGGGFHQQASFGAQSKDNPLKIQRAKFLI